MRTRATLIPLALAASLGLAACGSSNETASSAAAPATAAAAASSAASTAPDTGTKVNANDASEAELATAFAAAGIPNADRWAREVAEYRPYDDAPTWGKLRQELAKYNIDPAVLEQIIAVLEI